MHEDDAPFSVSSAPALKDAAPAIVAKGRSAPIATAEGEVPLLVLAFEGLTEFFIDDMADWVALI